MSTQEIINSLVNDDIPMRNISITKAQEIELLTEFANKMTSFKGGTYVGDWLSKVLPSVSQSLKCDIIPYVTMKQSQKDATLDASLIIEKAEREAKEIIEQAEKKAKELTIYSTVSAGVWCTAMERMSNEMTNNANRTRKRLEELRK